MNYFDILFPNGANAMPDLPLKTDEELRAVRIAALVGVREGYKTIRPACPRCGGSGRMSMFAHVAGGVCFACNGDGFVGTA